MHKNFDEADVVRTRLALVSACAYPWTDTYVTRRKKGDAAGGITPNFHRRIQSGDLVPFQPYTKYDMLATQEWTRRQDLKPILCQGNPNFRPWTVSGFDVSPLWASRDQIFEMAWTRARANTYLVNKAFAKCTGSVDIASFLAELKKGAEELLHLAPAIAGFLSRRPALNDPASVWLAWRMGIKPLVEDLEDIYNYLRKPPATVSIVKGLAEMSTSETVKTVYPYILVDGQGSHCDATCTDRLTIMQNGRAAIKNPIYTSHKALNWNLAGALWEVTPWSFLIDRFYDVSNFIRALTAAVTTPLSSRTGSYGIRFEMERDITLSNFLPGPTVENITISGESRQSATCVLRILQDVNYPQWLPRVSWETIIDIIMLILSQAARIVSLAKPKII